MIREFRLNARSRNAARRSGAMLAGPGPRSLTCRVPFSRRLRLRVLRVRPDGADSIATHHADSSVECSNMRGLKSESCFPQVVDRSRARLRAHEGLRTARRTSEACGLKSCRSLSLAG